MMCVYGALAGWLVALALCWALQRRVGPPREADPRARRRAESASRMEAEAWEAAWAAYARSVHLDAGDLERRVRPRFRLTVLRALEQGGDY